MNQTHVQGPQINQFNNVAPLKIPRSSFKRDFTRRTTFNPDTLVPIFVDEILPGDQVNLSMTALTRLSTPVKPIMDNLYLETFWFFIPNRLVWSNWEKFQGQKTNPSDSTVYTIPVLDKTKAPMSTTGFTTQSVYDYLGLPILVTGLSGVSCLFNRAIDLCWNEWFRDESLQNSLTIQTGDGPDDPAIYDLRKRNNRKDYFTSCLPWPQKGDAVSLPLGTSAPVISAGITDYGRWLNTNGTQLNTVETVSKNNNANNSHVFGTGSGTPLRYDPNGTLIADLSTATAATINTLRQAALYQQILELDARGGTRYVESIYTRFGVISPDFRLQRPELIGQGSNRFNVYAVAQTAPTAAGVTPQGNLAAFGLNTTSGQHGCRYAATEHGMIIGLANVRADLTYQQGLDKMFTRSTRLDFYEPLLNGLGEQTVTNGEIYAQGTSADADPFGYQERFSEYRFKNSQITGYFRSTAPSTLDVWHLAKEFGSLPALNSSFITEAVPIDRALAVATSVAPAFLCDISYSYTHVRPMPIRSNPGITRL